MLHTNGRNLLIKSAPVAQLDRVPDYESGGRTFESCRVHHLFNSLRATPSRPFCFAHTFAHTLIDKTSANLVERVLRTFASRCKEFRLLFAVNGSVLASRRER
jgi:hypothetical protein